MKPASNVTIFIRHRASHRRHWTFFLTVREFNVRTNEMNVESCRQLTADTQKKKQAQTRTCTHWLYVWDASKYILLYITAVSNGYFEKDYYCDDDSPPWRLRKYSLSNYDNPSIPSSPSTILSVCRWCCLLSRVRPHLRVFSTRHFFLLYFIFFDAPLFII